MPMIFGGYLEILDLAALVVLGGRRRALRRLALWRAQFRRRHRLHALLRCHQKRRARHGDTGINEGPDERKPQ